VSRDFQRAACYARYSSDLQSEASIPDQFRACERIASASGFEVVARFEDRAISAGTAERPGYQAMLTAARARAFDVVLSEDTSRLWRNMAEQSPRLAELSDIGVIVVTRDLDTRQESAEIMGAVMGAMAATYRKQVSYRTLRGLEGRARAGLSVGGKCYGYAPGEAVVVVQIYRDFANGIRCSRIAKELNARGIPGPRGPRWSLNAVKRILRNPRFKGIAVWGRTESRGGAQDSRRKRHVARPEGPLVQRSIPALVDPLVWMACNPGADPV
jgi:DNA invertase Pin-like site-specific DNA recombinase